MTLYRMLVAIVLTLGLAGGVFDFTEIGNGADPDGVEEDKGNQVDPDG